MKKNREIFEKAFPKAYIEHGMNATKAYKALRPAVTYKTANVEGATTLAKPSIKKSIEEILEGNNLSVELATKIHKRNLEQDDDLSVSQKAVQDVYKLHQLKGFSGDKNNNTSNTLIVIKQDNA